MTLGKSLTLSELQFPHLLSKDISSHLTGLAWDFKIIYIKCLCFIERAIVIASNGFGTGLYLGTAEERKRTEREVGTLIIHSSRNFSGPAACWAMLGGQQGTFPVPLSEGGTKAGWKLGGGEQIQNITTPEESVVREREARGLREVWLWPCRPRVNVC